MARKGTAGEWMTTWLLPVVAGLTAAAAPIFWEFSSVAADLPTLASGTARNGNGPDSTHDPKLRFSSPWFYLFVLATLTAISLTVLQGALSTRRTRKVRRALSDFNHSLGDTILALGRLPDARNGSEARDAFFDTVVREAKAIMPVPSPRVCVRA